MAIAALYALVLLAPPLVSTDIFSYQAYARMGALYGTNPYLHGPHAIALDPVFPYIGAKWSYIPSAYGPVFTAFSYLLAPLSIAASVFAYKAIAAMASLGAGRAGLAHARALRGIDPVRAAALVGLNPLLVIYGVGGGHNDLLMLLAVAGRCTPSWRPRAPRRRPDRCSRIGIKLTAGLMLPFAIAAGGPARGRSRRRDLLVGAGAALALVGSGQRWRVFGTGALNLLVDVQPEPERGRLAQHPRASSTSGSGLPTVGHIVGYVLAAAFVGRLCWLLRRVVAGTAGLDRRRRLGDGGDAGGRQLAVAVVRGVAAAARGAGTRSPAVQTASCSPAWCRASRCSATFRTAVCMPLTVRPRRLVDDSADDRPPRAADVGPRARIWSASSRPSTTRRRLVEEFYARVCAALEGLPFELVLVDDGSSDGSPMQLERLAGNDPRVRVVSAVAQLRASDGAHRRPRPRQAATPW